MENNKDLTKSISEAIQTVHDHLESTNQKLLVIAKKIKAQLGVNTTTYYEHYLDNGKHENLIGEFYDIKYIVKDGYDELVIVRDKNWDFFLIRGKKVSGRYYPDRGGIHYTIRKIDDTDWEIMASIVEKVRPKIHVEASTNKI